MRQRMIERGGMTLGGKAALVSGAAGGIGRAISLAFAEAGAAVACCDIDLAGRPRPRGSSSGRRPGARPLRRRQRERDAGRRQSDTRRLWPARHPGQRRRTARSAGTGLETSLADWQQVLAINLTGSFLLCRAALPSMIASGGGSIILIASQLGRVGSAGRAAYCATKGALIQLAKVMAIDHAGHNVRVNTLSPGAVETERLLRRYGRFRQRAKRSAPSTCSAVSAGRTRLPRRRCSSPSDGASFVTGSDLLVDGGYTAI